MEEDDLQAVDPQSIDWKAGMSGGETSFIG